MSERENVTLGQLAGERAAQALEFSDELAQLDPGSPEWLNVVKAQSMVHDDVVKYGELELKQESEKNRTKMSIIGSVLGVVGAVASAGIGWLFYDHRVRKNMDGDYVDRDVKEGSNYLTRTVGDGINRISSDLKRR